MATGSSDAAARRLPGGRRGANQMAGKVIGPTGSRRRRWLFLCTSFAAIAIAVLVIPSAFAVHNTGYFELDGNAASTSGTGGAIPDDWDRVCYQVTGNSGCGTTSTTH